MNSVCTIYLVRHGQSEGNILLDKPESKWQDFGELGSNLSQEGEKQALLRAEELRDIPFSAVFSSDLARAKTTAEIIRLDRKLEVETTQLLREREWGDTGGRTREEMVEEIQRLQKGLTDREKMKVKVTETMESEAEAVSRLLTVLREIAVGYIGKNVLVISHNNLMRSLLIHLGYHKYDELYFRSIDNTGYIILESDGIDFFVKQTYGIHTK